jgi:4-amino-4-deoxy-L-arabinose transferase-like glycosyltransferase
MFPSSAPPAPLTELPAASPPGATRPWLAQPENQLLLALLVVVLPLWFELGRGGVQLWDESRLAVNAAEMARDGHWLVPHFDSQPDHWNTKPPLLIWLEALSLRVLGFSTWALRLPTLLASLTTVVLLYQFAARVLRRPLAGVFGAMVLVTCTGYVRLHVARTADYDALLVCWQVLLWTQFFQYLENGQRRHLVWVFVALLGGALTKGPAGLLGLPGLAVYALGRGRLLWLLRQPGLYIAAATWLAVMTGYFVEREALDPGYWKAVQANDLGGRYLTVIEGHRAGWSYYLENLVGHWFSQWLWALVPAGLLLWLQPPGLVRRASGLLLAFVGGWLLVVSTAQSKLEWYDAPIYPALALLVGLGLNILYQDLLGLYRPRLGRGGWVLQVGLLGALFYPAYQTIIRQIIEERHNDYGLGADGHLGRYITKVAHEQPQYSQLILLTGGTVYPVLQYYRLQEEHTPGRQLDVMQAHDMRELTAGKVVMFCDRAYRPRLDSAFQVVQLHEDYPCQTVLLLPRPTPGSH